MRKLIAAFLILIVCPALAETGKIVKIGSEVYSQSAYITQNRSVYWVQADSKVYKITRRKEKGRVTLQIGDIIQFTTEPAKGKDGVIGHLRLTRNGKQTEYEIIGEE